MKKRMLRLLVYVSNYLLKFIDLNNKNLYEDTLVPDPKMLLDSLTKVVFAVDGLSYCR